MTNWHVSESQLKALMKHQYLIMPLIKRSFSESATLSKARMIDYDMYGENGGESIKEEQAKIRCKIKISCEKMTR